MSSGRCKPCGDQNKTIGHHNYWLKFFSCLVWWPKVTNFFCLLKLVINFFGHCPKCFWELTEMFWAMTNKYSLDEWTLSIEFFKYFWETWTKFVLGWTSMWHLMQNGCVMLVLTTLLPTYPIWCPTIFLINFYMHHKWQRNLNFWC
jgi:hypothetical protein